MGKGHIFQGRKISDQGQSRDIEFKLYHEDSNL